MELKAGNFTKIPYEDGFFDKVCVINCIYFWPNPVVDLKEILRVLKNKGKLIISVYTKEMAKKSLSCGMVLLFILIANFKACSMKLDLRTYI
jgi:SAM-dependent methyltransferase